jgi:hypothetical protein
MVNHETIGEGDTARGGLDPRDQITEMIDIRAHRKRGIGLDTVRCEQVGIARGMYTELESIGV